MKSCRTADETSKRPATTTATASIQRESLPRSRGRLFQQPPQALHNLLKPGPLAGLLRPAALHQYNVSSQTRKAQRVWAGQRGSVRDGQPLAARERADNLHVVKGGRRRGKFKIAHESSQLLTMCESAHNLWCRESGQQQEQPERSAKPQPPGTERCSEAARRSSAQQPRPRTSQKSAPPQGTVHVSSSYRMTPGSGRQQRC